MAGGEPFAKVSARATRSGRPTLCRRAWSGRCYEASLQWRRCNPLKRRIPNFVHSVYQHSDFSTRKNYRAQNTWFVVYGQMLFKRDSGFLLPW